MLGFRMLSRGISQTCKSISKANTYSFNNYRWHDMETKTNFMRCLPVPASGLLIQNIRQMMQKQSSETQIATLLADIIGMQQSPNMSRCLHKPSKEYQ